MIQLRGEVLIQAIDINNNISTLVDDKNLIVYSGRNNICNFLTNTNGSSYIYDVAFGYGGTVPGNPNIALSVDAAETHVNTPYTNLVNGIDYSFTPAVEVTPSPRAIFSMVIPSTMLPNQLSETALNGQGISELALMLNTSPVATAFAIKRFPSIVKSSTISLIITWVIYL